jgi:hypothetical protein
MSVKGNIVGGMAELVLMIVGILGFVIHVWTTVIAFSTYGLLAAGLTLVFPVLSEAFCRWFFKTGLNVGFWSLYCVYIMAYMGLIVVAWVLVVIMQQED